MASSLSPAPHKRRQYIEVTTTRRVSMAFIRLFVKSSIKLEAEGFENFPKKGSVILAANHVTNFDVLVMQVITPRPIFFMAKIQLYKTYSDWWLRRMGAFPVVRGGKDDWALNHAQKVLAEYGETLGIFPEGSRSKGTGLKKGKTGAARLALETNSPILPLALTGTDLVFGNFPRRTKVTLKMGKPVFPQKEDTPLSLTTRFMTDIAKMLPENKRGVYR